MGSKVSMDGRGRWMDNVFIERLWRNLKCEEIYLKDYRNVPELEEGVWRWIEDYNHERIHQILSLYVAQFDWRRPELFNYDQPVHLIDWRKLGEIGN